MKMSIQPRYFFFGDGRLAAGDPLPQTLKARGQSE
jgi:hypothetical protein